MTERLKRKGHPVNRKRVQRLMGLMGLDAVCPRPRLSQPPAGHPVSPYWLRAVRITRVNQVWGTDITSVRLRHGWLYGVALIDGFSRSIVSWEVSTSLEVTFCVAALDQALTRATPAILNSDQGRQFTSVECTQRWHQHPIRISRDGRGRCFDHIFTERFWRSLNYEAVYLNDYQSVREATQGMAQSMNFYNPERPHQSLDYKTPAGVHFDL
jgi:putative transposase